MRKFALKLPTIPEPAANTRTVFGQPDSAAPHPYLRGAGPADLLCGRCEFRLAEGIGPGQITNLVLRCPKCGAFSDINFIPALEELVSELVLAPDPVAKALALKAKLEAARNTGAGKGDVAAAIQPDSDVLAKFLTLIEPKSAGDFYGMLGCIVAFLAFLATLKQMTSPAVVVNQYITTQAVPAAASRSAPCPCGSGKKFKHCHGRRK